MFTLHIPAVGWVAGGGHCGRRPSTWGTVPPGLAHRAEGVVPRHDWPGLPVGPGLGCQRDVPAREVIEADLEVAGETGCLTQLPGCAIVEPCQHLGLADAADLGEVGRGQVSGVSESAHCGGDDRIDVCRVRARAHSARGWRPTVRFRNQQDEKAASQTAKALYASETRSTVGGMYSPLYLLADRILRETQGVSLRDWVLQRRQRLHRVSWAELARRLGRATSGQVSVTTVTLRSWFAVELERARSQDERDVDGGRVR